MSIAKLIHESLAKQYWTDDSLTIEQAKNTANFSALLHTADITEMAEEGQYSYKYIYRDDSELIIDDEGFIYCTVDNEINVLCKTDFN
jgi:hypothetical protein